MPKLDFNLSFSVGISIEIKVMTIAINETTIFRD